MSKRKGRKRKTTDVTAEALIATGAQAIVVSAGTDETILTNLIRLCKKMKSAASKQLKVVKLSAAKCGQNGCKNKSDKHCGICSVAICDECLEDPCEYVANVRSLVARTVVKHVISMMVWW